MQRLDVGTDPHAAVLEDPQIHLHLMVSNKFLSFLSRSFMNVVASGFVESSPSPQYWQVLTI